MHFLGLEIASGGTRAVAIGLECTRVIARAAAPHRWIGAGSQLLNPYLSLLPIYQERMARQQYLVDTLHPAGFL